MKNSLKNLRKSILLTLLVLISISAWGQTASSFSVTSVEIWGGRNAITTDENWVNEVAKFVSGMNEIAGMFNTGVVQYRVDRLNSLEEQLLQRANAALSNETIRRGETWMVSLNQMRMENAPRGTRAYTFYFHRESNGELYYLCYRRDKM